MKYKKRYKKLKKEDLVKGRDIQKRNKISEIKEKKEISKKENLNLYLISFIIVISSIIIFNKLSVFTLIDWDESRNGENALEILKTNDWGVMKFGGQADLWNLKPPLGAWLIAISYKIFGYGEFGLRFWSAIFGIGSIIIIYFFGKEIANKYVGLFGAVALLTNRLFIGEHGVRTGDYDSALTFFITLSIFLFYMFEKMGNRKYIYGFSVAVSLAVLTKEIVGIFPIIIVFIYYLSKLLINKDDIIGNIGNIIGNKTIRNSAIIFIILTFPWFIYRYIRGKDFINKMVEYDIIQRTGQSIEGHFGDWTYYLSVLNDIYGLLYIPIIILTGYSIYYFRKEKELILPIWILFFLLIFSYAKTKLFWYIDPMYPAMGLLIGYFINKIDYKVLILSLLVLLVPLYSVIDLTEHPFINPAQSSLKDSREYLQDFNTVYINSTENSQSTYLYLNFYSKNVSILEDKNINDIKVGDGIITFDSNTANLLQSSKDYRLVRFTDYLAIFKRID